MHLTAREFQIFSAIGERLTVFGIAAKTDISVETVEEHVETIKTAGSANHRSS